VRLMLFLVGTVSAGAVGVTQGVIPLPTQMVQAIRALGVDPARVRLGNANLADTYNEVLPQILRGHRPEELGFHVDPVTIPPGSFRGMNSPAGTIAQNGFASSILSEAQQNSIRMQDMANFTRNPAAWHGAPPR
jgi:hypothetical protein